MEAYKRLSPEFQKRLEGLRVVHSAHEQAENSRRRGGPVRREPIETEVRPLPPFTRANALSPVDSTPSSGVTPSRAKKRSTSTQVSPAASSGSRPRNPSSCSSFCTTISARGLISRFVRGTSRVRLSFGYVCCLGGGSGVLMRVLQDNRVTVHSALADFDPVARRHAVRLTPQAEVPIAATAA